MSVKILGTLFITVLMSLFVTGCGDDLGTQTMSAQVNPALVSRSFESQTFRLVAEGDESGIVDGGDIVSATLGEIDLVVESFEFVTEYGVLVTVSADAQVRSGSKPLVITIEHDHGTYALIADVQVM